MNITLAIVIFYLIDEMSSIVRRENPFQLTEKGKE